MTNDLTQGNIEKQLYLLSKPSFIGIFSIIAFQLCDSYFLSLYGTNELAAATFSYPLFSIIIALFVGLSNGSSIVLSPLVGAKSYQKFKNYNTHILLFSLILGFSFISIILFQTKNIISLFSINKYIFELSYQYLFITFIGLFFLFITLIFNGSLKSLGYTHIIGRSMYLSSLINFILDPILIFGIGIFPEMGIKGAALATVIGWIFSFVFVLNFVIKKSIFQFSSYYLKFFISNIKEWVSHSMATAISQSIISVINIVSIFFLANYSSDILAGFGLAYRLEKLSLIVAVALSSAVMIFCGQNLGDKNPKRIKQGVSTSNKWLFIILGSITLVTFSLTLMKNIIPLEESAFEAFQYYLVIILLSNVFHGYTIIHLGILSGLKKTKQVFYINIFKCFFTSGLIAAFFYTMDSYTSVFIAISLGNFFMYLITNYYIKKEINTLK